MLGGGGLRYAEGGGGYEGGTTLAGRTMAPTTDTTVTRSLFID